MSNEMINRIREKLKNRPSSGGGGGTGGDLNWFKTPDEGEWKVRFLPPVGEEDTPGFLRFTHWNIPEVKSLTCLRTFQRDCPICNMLEELGGRVPEEMIKEYLPQGRAFHNVLNMDKNPPEYSIMNGAEYTYWWLFQQIENPEVGDITDPTASHTVTMKRQSRGGKIDRIISLKSSPIAESQEEIDKIINNAKDLTKIFKYTDDMSSKAILAAGRIKADLLQRVNEMTEEDSSDSLRESKGENPGQPPKGNNLEPLTSAQNAKPKGVPDCFGSWKPEGDEKRLDKCTICPSEFECETYSTTES